MLTHRSLVASLEQSIDLIGVESAGPGALRTAVLHIYGMNVLMNGLRQRAALIRCPGSTLPSSCGSSPTTRPSCSSRLRCQPRQASACRPYDLSSLQVIFSGAARWTAPRQGRRGEAGLRGAPGLRDDRDEPGESPSPRPRRDPAGHCRLTIPNMGASSSARWRRGIRFPVRHQPAGRAVVQGPERDAGLLR